MNTSEEYWINRDDYRDSVYQEPATDKQLAFLERLGLEYSPIISKGTASDVIERELSLRNGRATVRRVLAIMVIGGLVIAGYVLYSMANQGVISFSWPQRP